MNADKILVFNPRLYALFRKITYLAQNTDSPKSRWTFAVRNPFHVLRVAGRGHAGFISGLNSFTASHGRGSVSALNRDREGAVFAEAQTLKASFLGLGAGRPAYRRRPAGWRQDSGRPRDQVSV